MFHPIVPTGGSLEGEDCWSHGVSKHDFFLNYRVALEGKQTPGSKVYEFTSSLVTEIKFLSLFKEPSFGVVQIIYDRLAVKKTKSGIPIFVFWDKKCLNYGANWESGFLSGLKTAKVIILLISNKVKINKQRRKKYISYNIIRYWATSF